jgi:hypothetical protein
MEKTLMRDWIAALEVMVNNKLTRWDRQRKWENGEVVHLMWQWEQTIMKLDIFWQDEKEIIRLKYFSPHEDHDYMWNGLNNSTFNKVQDRIGNLAMRTVHPPIDPTDIPIKGKDPITGAGPDTMFDDD